MTLEQLAPPGGWGWFDAPDNWDIQSLSVTLTSYNPQSSPSLPTRNGWLEARKTPYSGAGNDSWVRLTLDNPSCDFTFQQVGYTPADYYFGPQVIVTKSAEASGKRFSRTLVQASKYAILAPR